MTDRSPESLQLSESPVEHRVRRFWCRAVICAALAAGMIGVLSNTHPLRSANDRSRWCTIWSLVERGTYTIDEIIQRPSWNTIDKVRHDDHFYSSKPPLWPTICAGVYWAVKHATGLSLTTNTLNTAHAILLIVNLLPWLVAWWMLAKMIDKYARNDFTRYFLWIAAAGGTLITPYSLVLNNHTVAAFSTAFALAMLLQVVWDGDLRASRFFWCGFWGAFAACNDLPAGLLGVALFVWMFRSSPRKTVCWFIPAAMLPVLAFFGTIYVVTGSLKPFYLDYGSETYRYVHEGVPSYWMDPKGLDQSLDSWSTYLFHCTLGHHGILSLTPIWFLTLFAWLPVSRWNRESFGTYLRVSLFLTVAVLGFYLTRTEQYNYGGVSIGLRWMVWLIPLWLIGAIPVVDWCAERPWRKAFCLVLLAASVFSAIQPIPNPWQQPMLYYTLEQAGWINYDDPPPPDFPRPMTTWFPTLPTVGVDDKPVWVEYSAVDPLGKTQRLRLTVLSAAADQLGIIPLQVQRWLGAELLSDRKFFIDREKYEAGKASPDFLRWPEDRPDSAELAKIYWFFRGVPASRNYTAGKTRYVKTKWRTNAFRCQLASTRGISAAIPDQASLHFRRTCWWCDEVPFGVLQFEVKVYLTTTGELLSAEHWQLTAASDDDFARQPTQ